MKLSAREALLRMDHGSCQNGFCEHQPIIVHGLRVFGLEVLFSIGHLIQPFSERNIVEPVV